MFAFVCANVSGQTTPVYESIAVVLQNNVGQTIELHLKSGEKIGGKVARVGTTLIHLSQLTGMELFDADVNVSDISAVVARAKK